MPSEPVYPSQLYELLNNRTANHFHENRLPTITGSKFRYLNVEIDVTSAISALFHSILDLPLLSAAINPKIFS